MDPNFDKRYERESPEFIKQGNEFQLRKGRLFDYGPEQKLLRIQIEKPQWITVTFQVKPALVAALYRNASPVTGRLLVGADAGGASFEFDLNPGRDQDFHPASPDPGTDFVLSNLGGQDARRFGITEISVFTKALDVFARLDVNLRTLLPVTQPPDGDTAGIDPFPGTDFTVPVSAWAAYGTKGFGTVYKTYVISRATAAAFNSRWAVGTFVGIPIPAGAKRFRVWRQDNTLFTAPPVRASMDSNGVTATYDIPANSNEWVEMPRQIDRLSLRNDGGNPIDTASCEFQLEL